MKDREPIHEKGLPFGGYRLYVGHGDRDGATMHVNAYDSAGRPVDAYVMVGSNDLRAFAAQCLAAAEEVDNAQQATA